LERLKNPKLAFQYVRRSVEQTGSPGSQLVLSQLYAHGHGCPRNEEEARKFFRRARFQISQGGTDRDNISLSDLRLVFELWLIHGKELCEFEAQKGLKSENLSLSDRLERYHRESSNSSQTAEDEKTQSDNWQTLQSRLASFTLRTPSVYCPGFYVVQQRAYLEGSITAKNFLRSLYLREMVSEKLSEKPTDEEIDDCLETFIETWELNDLLTVPGPDLLEVSSRRLQQDPNHVNAALILGLYFNGSDSERIDYWKKFVAQHGKVAEGHNLLAGAYANVSEVSRSRGHIAHKSINHR